jgi:hypothetical protein
VDDGAAVDSCDLGHTPSRSRHPFSVFNNSPTGNMVTVQPPENHPDRFGIKESIV